MNNPSGLGPVIVVKKWTTMFSASTAIVGQNIFKSFGKKKLDKPS